MENEHEPAVEGTALSSELMDALLSGSLALQSLEQHPVLSPSYSERLHSISVELAQGSMGDAGSARSALRALHADVSREPGNACALSPLATHGP